MGDVNVFELAVFALLGVFVVGIIWAIFAIVLGFELPMIQDIRNDTPTESRGLSDSDFNSLYDIVHGRFNILFAGIICLVFLFAAVAFAYKRDSQTEYVGQGGY